MSLKIPITTEEDVRNLETMFSEAEGKITQRVIVTVSPALCVSQYVKLEELCRQYNVDEIVNFRQNPFEPTVVIFRVDSLNDLLDCPPAGAQGIFRRTNCRGKEYDSMVSECRRRKYVMVDGPHSDIGGGEVEKLPKSTFIPFLAAICPLVGRLAIAGAIVVAGGLLANNMPKTIKVKGLTFDLKESKLNVDSLFKYH